MKILRTPDSRFENLKDYPFEPNYTHVSTEDGSELKGIETFFKPPSLWASSANKLGFGTNAALTKTILLVLLHYFL